ncbi:MAG: hypothetical protein WBA79_06600 [Mycobacterium sp.]
MVAYDAPLTDAQFKVLQWINDGRPEGVFAGWAHRTSARALASRGLARVKGHGANWTATIEPAGTYYLEHGAFPDQPSVGPRTRSVPKRRRLPRPEPATAPITGDDAARPGPRSASTNTQKIGVAEQLIETLCQAGKSGLTVAPDELPTIRRRLARAERDNRIPAEHRVACAPTRINEQHGAIFRLQPIPRWHVAALRPRARKTSVHTAPATELNSSNTFRVTGEPRERALRLIDALVHGAQSHQMSVTAAQVQAHDRYDRNTQVRDELVFTIEPDQVSLHFHQGIDKVPHEPTERELARARRGYLFPDFDERPAENLEIQLGDDKTAAFWSAVWRDSDGHRLEEDLPRIIEEILFRLDHRVAAREAEERRQIEAERQLVLRRKAWDDARASAVIAFGDKFLRDAMLREARDWRKAEELRDYATAVSERAARLDEPDRIRLIDWAKEIREHAAKLDPITTTRGRPTPPPPSTDDLKPFMGKHGIWRP